MPEKAKNIIHIPVEQTNDISDGYHTFGELYEHRAVLYVALCRQIANEDRATPREVWRSKLHSDGVQYDDWFLLGIGKEKGEQITYHLPDKYWYKCEFAETLSIAPEFDAHTPEDVLKRIQEL